MSKDLEYYLRCFENLSVNKQGGQKAPHKPLLLLAVIDLVEQGVINSPCIELSDILIGVFKRNQMQYVRFLQRFQPNIGMPFYHLSGEPFWRLEPFTANYRPRSYAVLTLRQNYKYAVIDSELFRLMQVSEARQQLRQVLIETYLANRSDVMLLSLSPLAVLASYLSHLIA